MKRYFALVISLILVLSLTACGAEGQAPASGPSSSQGGGEVISGWESSSEVSSSELSDAPPDESTPPQSGEEKDAAIYRYDDLPGFPLPDIVSQKITYHIVLLGDKYILQDAELIEQTIELLDRVELCGPPFRAEEDAEPDRVVSFYQNPEEEEPAYSLCFLEDGSMYIETAEGRSEAYSTLNWVGTGEADGLALRLGRQIRVWIRPNDPDHPLPKGTLYTVKGSPFFQPAFDNVKKIYYYDAALGEDWTVTDPQVIGKIVKKIKNFTFYDEPAPDDPEADSFRYQCFEYFEFYENEEDDTPIFSMGLDPFYVKIGEEKFGPYSVDILDDEIIELLRLFL